MKLKKKSGFTLIEMLVVVAIIAILVAVSIPIVGNALEKSRQATDAANERAAKAEFIICYLNEKLSDGTTDFVTGKVYAYDAVNGKIVDTAPTEGYGKCHNMSHNNGILFGQVTATGDVQLGWWTVGQYPTSAEVYTADKLHNGKTDVAKP